MGQILQSGIKCIRLWGKFCYPEIICIRLTGDFTSIHAPLIKTERPHTTLLHSAIAAIRQTRRQPRAHGKEGAKITKEGCKTCQKYFKSGIKRIKVEVIKSKKGLIFIETNIQRKKIKEKILGCKIFYGGKGGARCSIFPSLATARHMNSMKFVIPLHSLYWSIHTNDESKRGTAFAFIFGVN